jgi:hypothetical protein
MVTTDWRVRTIAISLSLSAAFPLLAFADGLTNGAMPAGDVDSAIHKLRADDVKETPVQLAEASPVVARPTGDVDAIIDKIKSEDAKVAPAQVADAAPISTSGANPIQMRESLDVNSTPTGPKSVDDYTREILLAEIKLEKFNLHYRLEAAKQGRWKGWRFFALQEANSSCTMAGLIMGVAERGEHYENDGFKKNRNTVLENGNVLGGVGQCIGMGADALEFAINAYHSWEASHHGFSPNEAKNYVASLVSEIDKKMQERQTLLNAGQGTPDPQVAEMAKLETKVLADFRDLSVSEFERFHVGARKTLAQQQAFYLLDFTKNTTGAIANLLAEQAIKQKDRHYNDSAGIMMTISGAMIMADPLLSRAYAKMVEQADRRELERSGLPKLVENAAQLKTDFDALHAYCSSHTGMPSSIVTNSVNRLEAYDCNETYFTDQIQKNAAELRKGNRIAIQNIGSGLGVGATKVTAGALLTTAGVGYVGSAKETNRLIFWGNTTYLAGTGYAVLDNARIQVSREITYQKQKSKGQLSGPLIHARLDRLDQIEKKI